MKSPRIILAAALPLLLLAGCASVPSGPSVMALPGSGKNFDQFRRDDAECRQYAQYQIGGADANQAAVDAGVRSAAVGTAIGGRDSAGVGAGTGLLVGSMAGSGAAQSSAYGTQRSYDNAYIQCMYAKGEQVPVPHALARSRAPAPAEGGGVPAAPSYLPPPPPGYPPPR